MTTAEFIKKEKEYYNWLVTKAIPFKQSVYNVVASQSKRIFEDGLNSSMTKMKSPNGGVYDSKTPLYVNQKLIKGGGKLGTPKGKTGKSKFKNGKSHKLNYLNSYKDLRQKLGRRTDAVTLQLNYDLFSDFANSPKTSDFSPPKKITPKAISPTEYIMSFSRKINQKKKDGLEDRYGKIFNLTAKEKILFKETFEYNLRIARENFNSGNAR